MSRRSSWRSTSRPPRPLRCASSSTRRCISLLLQQQHQRLLEINKDKPWENRKATPIVQPAPK
eukprot:4697249-Heterocapsa_arctica.AAC.1